MNRMSWVGALAILLGAQSAQSAPVGVVVTAKAAPVLEVPAPGAGAVGAASLGQVYGAIARDGFFVQVVFNGGSGWLATSDIAESGPVSAVTLTRDAYVRTGPGTGSDVAGSAGAGQTYAALGAADGYVEITFGGGNGFVAAGAVVNDVLGGALDDLGPGAPAGARLPPVLDPFGGFGNQNFVDPLSNLSSITSAQSSTPPPAATPPQYTTAGNDQREAYRSGGADDTTPSAPSSSGGGGGGGCFAGAMGGGGSLVMLAGFVSAALLGGRRTR